MKILLDVTNTPHVLFFRPIIKELEKKGHKIKIVARMHSQTIDMLNFFKLKYKVIGKHAGKSLFKKALNTVGRVFALKKAIKQENPDLCLCHQSPYLILASKLCGIKSIYIFDNDRAKLQNLLAIPFASKVLCPEAIKQKSMYGKKLIKYPSVKEAVYLHDFKADKGTLKKLKLSKKKKIVVMRAEPFTAAYYKEEKDVLKEIIKKLVKEKNIQIVFIPRDEKQREEYEKSFGNKIIIPKKAVDGPSLVYLSDLVIGAGGTMNREAAILGTPVISTYKGKLLAVDKYLIKNKLMIHSASPSIDLVKKNLKRKIKGLVKKGGSALNLIIKEIVKNK